ncbi:MAG: class II aldolase/adducin family protein [Gammaproteobacteria bacterium]
MSNLTTMRAENIASDAEWQTRCELAALYRIMDIYGMTDLSNQAVGARVKDEPDHYLIHPYGIFFEEIRASDFIKIDGDGKPVDGVIPTVATAAVNPINDGVKNLSNWIFGTRPEVNYFIHAHCGDVMAVSATESGLLPLSQAAVYLMHFTTYIDYEFFEDDVFAEKFKETLGNHDIVISHNHGYYALGCTAAEAFFHAYFLRQACSVQLKVMYTGDKMRLMDPKRVARYQEQMYSSEHYNYDGSTEWQSLLRKLDRQCPDYKT